MQSTLYQNGRKIMFPLQIIPVMSCTANLLDRFVVTLLHDPYCFGFMGKQWGGARYYRQQSALCSGVVSGCRAVWLRVSCKCTSCSVYHRSVKWSFRFAAILGVAANVGFAAAVGFAANVGFAAL